MRYVIQHSVKKPFTVKFMILILVPVALPFNKESYIQLYRKLFCVILCVMYYKFEQLLHSALKFMKNQNL